MKRTTTKVWNALACALLLGACGSGGASSQDAGEVIDGDAGIDLCADVVCEALDSCHVAGVCDPATGTCSNPIAANDTPCDDGSACTYGDRCEQGVCTGGGDVVCRPLDQCHEAGVCDPESGCSNPVKADGAACGDGDACTTGDSCQAGVCVGEAVTCEAPDACHEDGACNSATGQCVFPNKPDGTACDDGDGDLCAVDECRAGECVGIPKTCAPEGPCYQAGTCDAGTGACVPVPKPDFTACDDENACTRGDLCVAGECRSGDPVVCEAIDQCHDAGTCDPVLGCSSPPKADGAACDDGNLCTDGDVCTGGACGGAAVTCVASDSCHVAGECNPVSGCSETPKPDGTTCDDGNACTEDDSCASGVCGGADVTCVASDSCHVAGTCDPIDGCSETPKPDGTSCDDGNECTENDRCTAGTCAGPDTVVCPEAPDCRDDGVCMPATGTCFYPSLADGEPCDDEDLCTQRDECSAGVCVGSDPVVCEDPCRTNLVCEPGTGLCGGTPVANGTICEDGNLCTTGDSCQGGDCRAGDPVVCTPLDGCHEAGFCDPYAGQCTDPHRFSGSCGDDGVCFVDVTSSALLRFGVVSMGPYMGGAAAFLDYDGDGWQDLLLAAENGGIVLYRNQQDGTFVDVSEAAGIPAGVLVPMGLFAADFDNDSDPDVLITAVGDNVLLENQGGVFVDVTSTALPAGETRWTAAGAFGDFDHDGDLDLFVGNYLESFAVLNPTNNELWINNGDGTFSEAAAAYGVDAAGATLAAMWTDVNGDGWSDLLVCNDFGASLAANKLYINRGDAATGPGDRFAESSVAMSADVEIFCMGIAAGDIDRDEDLDYYFTNIGANVLLQNDLGGAGEFSDSTIAAGVGVGRDSCEVGERVSAWGAAFHDFDADGWLDLYVANGHLPAPPPHDNVDDSPNSLLRNDGTTGLVFEDVSLSSGLADPRMARGVAFADYDRDGDLDVVQVNIDGSVALLRNDTSNGNGYLQVELEGRTSAFDAIGARVAVALPAGASLVREAMPHMGYLSSSEKTLHFGLGGAAHADAVTVTWPSGIAQQAHRVSANARLSLLEPAVTVTSVVPAAATVAEAATVQVTVNLENHTASAVDVQVALSVLDGVSEITGGPTANVTVPADGTASVDLDLVVAAGTITASPTAADVVATVTDGPGAADQGISPLEITN